MAPKVLIIGAGWAGLSAARTYTRVNPEADITILDDDTSVGGVWSASRLYPGLLADSPRGLFEYSDLSMMDEDVFVGGQKIEAPNEDAMQVDAAGAKEGASLSKREKYGLIRGKEVHNYLHKYAEKWDLLPRIRFESRVVKAERIARDGSDQTGWRITLSTNEAIDCDKLIVASGLYSEPTIPEIPGLDSFRGFSIHSKLLGQQHQRLSDPSIKTVTVIGGCKSALEAINLCLALPNRPQINWVIRHSIPIIFNDPTLPVSLLAANNMRFFGAFSPSIFDTESGLYRFFHSGRNWLGNWLYNGFWKLMTWTLMRDGGYDNSEQGRLIKPDVMNLYKTLLYVSLIHKGNPVLDEIHKGERVKVHMAELDHLTPTSIVTRNLGTNERKEVHSNAVIWCTGWKASTSYFNPTDTATLGLPIPVASQSPATHKRWADLQLAADIEVTKIFPTLANFAHEPPKEPLTNYRMYRQVVSPGTIASNDRSIAFAGFVSNSQTAFASELTALWGIAWLEGVLKREDFGTEEEMEMEVARVHAWMARRYGGRGWTTPEVVLEVQTYFDMLVGDLGAKVRRKGGWREWFGIYGAHDYKGLVEEVMAKKGGQRGKL